MFRKIKSEETIPINEWEAKEYYDRETKELLKTTKDYKYAESPIINCLQDILWELRYIRRKIDRPE